jgi:hypothetical protein
VRVGTGALTWVLLSTPASVILASIGFTGWVAECPKPEPLLGHFGAERLAPLGPIRFLVGDKAILILAEPGPEVHPAARGKALRRGVFRSVPDLIASIEDDVKVQQRAQTRRVDRHRGIQPQKSPPAAESPSTKPSVVRQTRDTR